MLPDGDVASAAAAEYACKYCCKKEAAKQNHAFLDAAMDLVEEKDKPLERIAKSLLAKFLNSINGSITISLVMMTGCLLGHDDHWFPLHTTSYDIRWHEKKLKSKYKCLDEVDQLQEDTLACKLEMDEDNDQFLKLTTQVDGYLNRCTDLQDWSSYELTMCFNIVKIRSKSTSSLRLQETSTMENYGHQPRESISVPQPYTEFPMRPNDDSSIEDKNSFAAFALGNFYPYDVDKWWNKLFGDTLWEKFLYWEKAKPRGERDHMVLRMLQNIETRCKARLVMKQEMKTTKLRQRHIMGGNYDPMVRHV